MVGWLARSLPQAAVNEEVTPKRQRVLSPPQSPSAGCGFAGNDVDNGWMKGGIGRHDGNGLQIPPIYETPFKGCRPALKPRFRTIR